MLSRLDSRARASTVAGSRKRARRLAGHSGFGALAAVLVWLFAVAGNRPRSRRRPRPWMAKIARLVVSRGSRWQARRRLALQVDGLDLIPPKGPVLIVCRHYHHTYDGIALLATIPRPLHLVVALDWAPNALVRSTIELGCRLLAWPAVIRTDAIRHQRTAYRPNEATRYNRRAGREAVRLLRAGEVVAIFPEAYPNIDPAFTPKLGDEQLPFREGFARLADIASKDGSVAVIPAGLHYERGAPWNVTLRYGAPIVIDGPEDGLDLRTVAEARVRALSGGLVIFRE